MPEQTVLAFRIRHLLWACDEIEKFRKHRSYNEFYHNRMVMRTVETCFRVLWDEAHHLPMDIKSRYPDIPWDKIENVMNYFSYHYDHQEYEDLSVLIERELPVFHKGFEKILAEEIQDQNTQ
ncbi:MAG: hypothetical protein DHS20C02_17030 [Micavibrio sp.]|nr:MAG: hypothetical protein DHS20C02_17030 [Micavibrio sp.]